MKAFISYSRADWRDVERIARELRSVGLQTWVDTENIRPGDQWHEAIGNAIRTSDAFIACISPFSAESVRTPRELETAIAAGLVVFPVMIEPTPIESLPHALRERHVVSMFRHPPALGPRRIARQIARALGVPDVDNGAIAHDGRIDVLILRVGESDPMLRSHDFVDSGLGEDLILAEKTVNILDRVTLAGVTEWLVQSAHVYLVVGHGARVDDAALICGMAFSTVGSRRFSLVSCADGVNLAERMSEVIECRLIRVVDR